MTPALAYTAGLTGAVPDTAIVRRTARVETDDEAPD